MSVNNILNTKSV